LQYAKDYYTIRIGPGANRKGLYSRSSPWQLTLIAAGASLFRRQKSAGRGGNCTSTVQGMSN